MSDGELSIGWALTTLGVFGELFCGQSLPPSKVNRDGRGVPYVTGPEHWDGQKVHLNKWTTEPARLAPEGCIFITVKGAGVGKLFPGVPCAIGRDLYAYRASSEIPRKFVELSLRYTIAEVVAEAKGDIPGLSKNHILDHSIPLPPLAEQKRIVAKIEELFSELDAGEESQRLARRQLGVYRQSLLKQAFEGKLTAPWRTQHPDLLESPDQLLARIQSERQARYRKQVKKWEAAGSGRGKPKKPEAIKPVQDLKLASPRKLPTGWTWIAVGDVGRIETGTTPPTKEPNNYGGVTPFFKPTDLEQGATVREAREHLSNKGREAARIIPAGTTLVTCIGATIGKTGLASVECATNQQINTISPEVCFESRFVYYAVIAPSLNGLVKSQASATTLPILNKSKFEALPFPLCTLPEQREIVRRLDEQFAVIEQNEREIDAALKRSAALRQSILKKAFTGNLVPQDPTDEPAAALLQRIREERDFAAKTPKKKVARKRITNRTNVMPTLIEVLKKQTDWISAQKAFEHLGIKHGSTTEEVEAAYNQLRDRISEVEVVRRGNEDWLRLKGGRDAN